MKQTVQKSRRSYYKCFNTGKKATINYYRRNGSFNETWIILFAILQHRKEEMLHFLKNKVIEKNGVKIIGYSNYASDNCLFSFRLRIVEEI